ncbi:MAG: UDP-N-acetylmuramoyl-L-alanine--D-glutamate ligase [Chlorobiaceae bacterium]|nr:UDP-N-acetylmuramoyl-L-alanine--D-glutamate ligase [Chlorobiaceae bacterium]
MNPEALHGKPVSVLGAGKSGLAAAELLVKMGARPFVSEYGAISRDARDFLRTLGVPFEEDGHSGRVHEAEFCVVSPGIPQTAPVLHDMDAGSLPVFSEIELASWFCPARIIGITGTDGKTTTATLIHRICEADGKLRGYRAFSVGNIGVPFSSKVLEMGPNDIAVLELSSYQLERCYSFRPDIAVLTNITPDHMDRYGGDINEYARTKFRIHAAQGDGETLIYNHDDPMLRSHFDRQKPWPFRVVRFGLKADRLREGMDDFVSVEAGEIVARTGGEPEGLIRVDTFIKPSFRGEHNLYNALASVAAARSAGIPREVIGSSLLQFNGVEHRQEFAGSACGLEWINDSKATNVNAMRQALHATPAGMVLIAGGRDKGNDYTPLFELVREKVDCIIAIGESQQKIVDAFRGVVAVKPAGSLRDAVSLAVSAGRPGSSVLFSPACSSFDMFINFEDRGIQFKQLVRELSSC